jgi:hypothetical protein
MVIQNKSWLRNSFFLVASRKWPMYARRFDITVTTTLLSLRCVQSHLFSFTNSIYMGLNRRFFHRLPAIIFAMNFKCTFRHRATHNNFKCPGPLANVPHAKSRTEDCVCITHWQGGARSVGYEVGLYSYETDIPCGTAGPCDEVHKSKRV